MTHQRTGFLVLVERNPSNTSPLLLCPLRAVWMCGSARTRACVRCTTFMSRSFCYLIETPKPLFSDGSFCNLKRGLFGGPSCDLDLGLEEKRGIEERSHAHEKRYPIRVTVVGNGERRRWMRARRGGVSRREKVTRGSVGGGGRILSLDQAILCRVECLHQPIVCDLVEDTWGLLGTPPPTRHLRS